MGGRNFAAAIATGAIARNLRNLRRSIQSSLSLDYVGSLCPLLAVLDSDDVYVLMIPVSNGLNRVFPREPITRTVVLPATSRGYPSHTEELFVGEAKTVVNFDILRNSLGFFS